MAPWSAEEKEQFLIKLLYHHCSAPSLVGVELPPGRTRYATEHLLRNLKPKTSDPYPGGPGTIVGDGNGISAPASPAASKKRPCAPATGLKKRAKKAEKNQIGSDETGDEVQGVADGGLTETTVTAEDQQFEDGI